MIDLLADLDIFGVSPEGLGVSFEHTSHLSNSNYLLEKSTLHQNEFKLSVVLGYVSQDPYNAYYKLVNFLDKAPYQLEYETSAGTWQREVRLKELTKTEIVTGDVMMEDFTLSCFTPWYRIVESKVDQTTDTPGDGKIYINYESTRKLKKIYAFAYSADGKDGFTTDYPNENMLEEIIPYGSDYFFFNTNDTTAWKEIKNNTIRMGITQASKYAQYTLLSDPDSWGGIYNIKPTMALRNLTVGAQYTVSTIFQYTGDIGKNTMFVIELTSHNKDGTRVNVLAKHYTYLNNVGEGKRTKVVITGTVPEGFYDNIKSVTLTFSMRSDADSTKSEGFIEFDNIKLEVGNKATGSGGDPTYYGIREVDPLVELDPSKEKPELYQWYGINGKWTPPTSSDRGYSLSYDNKVIPYIYSEDYVSPDGPSMHAYTYDYVYEGWVNGQNGIFRIRNDSIYMGSQKGSPLEIIIDGPATNPYWQIVKDAQVLQSDGINIDIAEGYRLIVSSVPYDQKCVLIAPDGTVSNVYQQQRLELTNFVTAPPGFSELIFFNAKKVGFRMREEYVVV